MVIIYKKVIYSVSVHWSLEISVLFAVFKNGTDVFRMVEACDDAEVL